MATGAFTVRAESDMVHQFDSIADFLCRSRNYLVNQPLREYLKNHAWQMEKISRGLEAPSSHIIKPSIQHRQDIPHTAINEALVMMLAERIGMQVAKVRYAPELKAVVIARYDRIVSPEGRLLRLHQNDLCQILGIPSGKKYEAEGGPSLKACFDNVAG